MLKSGLLLLVGIIQISFIFSINYPPSLEQINLGINQPFLLWLSRFISLVILLIATYLLSRKLEKGTILYWLIIYLSPLPTILIMSHPISCLILFLLTSISILTYKNLKLWPLFFLLLVSVLFLFNQLVLKQSFSIFQSASLTESQKEITHRITSEDVLSEVVYVPLQIRRFVYNKYHFSIKNTAREIIPFFDLESLFFVEVHPFGKKSIIIFYWPGIIFFFLGLVVLSNSNNKDLKKLASQLTLGSLLVFLFTSSQGYLRLAPLLWVISLLFSLGISKLFASQLKFPKLLMILLFLIYTYGFINNQYDMRKRPLVWLDNIPIYYNWLFSQAEKLDYQKYNNVYLADLFGKGTKYCEFYLENCQKINYSSFNLTAESTESATLYLGLQKNFNYSSNKPPGKVADLPYQIEFFDYFKLNDNIADKYGQFLMSGAVK